MLSRRQEAGQEAELADSSVEEAQSLTRVRFAGRKERFLASQGCPSSRCQRFGYDLSASLPVAEEDSLLCGKRSCGSVSKPGRVQLRKRDTNHRTSCLQKCNRDEPLISGRQADQQPCGQKMEVLSGRLICVSETRCLCDKSEIQTVVWPGALQEDSKRE